MAPSPSDAPLFPDGFFDRQDPSPDARFYAAPRMVVHIDAATIEALTAWYAETLAPGSDVLDLMSSWVSHLPPEGTLPLGRIVGLGMNAEELAANPRLAAWDVVDLNASPALPYEDASFDGGVMRRLDPVSRSTRRSDGGGGTRPSARWPRGHRYIAPLLPDQGNPRLPRSSRPPNDSAPSRSTCSRQAASMKPS